VQLPDLRGERGAEVWNLRCLVEPGGHHDILGAERSGARQEAVRAGRGFDAPHFDPAADGELKSPRVGFEVLDDLRTRHESVRVRSRVFRTRHAHLEVGRHESERIPALIAPGVCQQRGLLEHEVCAPRAGEVIAEGETGLAGTDQDGFDSLWKC